MGSASNVWLALNLFTLIASSTLLIKLTLVINGGLPMLFPESRTNCGINITNVKSAIRFKVYERNVMVYFQPGE